MNGINDNQPPEDESLLASVVDDVVARLKRGEQPRAEDYAARLPQLVAQIRTLIPTLHAMKATPPVGDPEAGSLEEWLEDRTLGDFRIGREIGRGGMGTVYEAEQISLGRRVALKVLPLAALLDARLLQRFKNEAQAAAQLHHNHIVPVHAVGCERGLHYYAMPYIEGASLAAVIDELRRSAPSPEPGESSHAASLARRLTGSRGDEPANGTQGREFLRSVARLGQQAAEALDHAHAVGVVHRDIKPSNLLLDQQGRLWVTDFGLAHYQLSGKDSLTLPGDLLGTARYMSPEQAGGRSVLMDHRTDVYSLGVTLYELLCLRPAFAADERQELLRQVTEDEPPVPRRLNPAIPPDLETIVLKAMAKEPELRYASAADLAADFERFLNDRPIEARRPGVRLRLRRWSQHHLGAVAAGMALLVLLSLGLGTTNWLLAKERAATKEQRDLAVRQQQRADDNYRRALEILDRGVIDLLETRLPQQDRLTEDDAQRLKDALGFYESFLKQNADLAEAREALAVAGQRVGRIRKALGQYAAAADAYAQSASILEAELMTTTDERRIRRLLLRTLTEWSEALKDADNLQRAEEVGRRAVQEAKRLTDELSATATDAPWLSESYAVLGRALSAAGRGPEAIGIHEHQLAAAEQVRERAPDEEATLRALAAAHEALGRGKAATGDWDSAETHYREALHAGRELWWREPGDLEHRARWAGAQAGFGDTLRRQERWSAAGDFIWSGFAERRALALGFPARADFRMAWRESALSLTLLLLATGRTNEAARRAEEAVSFPEGQSGAPGDIEAERRLVDRLRELGSAAFTSLSNTERAKRLAGAGMGTGKTPPDGASPDNGNTDEAATGAAKSDADPADGADGDLVAWWPMEATDTDQIQDHSGNGRHGECAQGAGVILDDERGAVLRLGTIIDQHVNFGADPAFNLSDGFTLAAWIRDDDYRPLRNQAVILGKGRNQWRLLLNSKGQIVLHLTGLRTTYTVHPASHALGVESRTRLSHKVWHHVAATSDGHRLTLYVDGRADAHELIIAGKRSTGGEPLCLGGALVPDTGEPRSRLTEAPFIGLLDDLRIYQRVLASEEIAALATPGTEEEQAGPTRPRGTGVMAAPIQPPPPNPMAAGLAGSRSSRLSASPEPVDLAMACDALGTRGHTLRRLGRAAEAEDAHGQQLILAGALAARAPESPESHRALGEAHGALAGLNVARAAWNEANAHFAEARNHYEALVAKEPANLDFRAALGQLQTAAGDALRHQGRWDEAEEPIKQGLAIHIGLVESHPAAARFVDRLWEGARVQTELLIDLGEEDRAAAYIGGCLELAAKRARLSGAPNKPSAALARLKDLWRQLEAAGHVPPATGTARSPTGSRPGSSQVGARVADDLESEAWFPAQGTSIVRAETTALSWPSVEGAKRYRVSLGPDPDRLSEIARLDAARGCRTRMPRLPACRWFAWRVDAETADGRMIRGPLRAFATGDLVAWWPMGGDGVEPAQDISGQGHHGTLVKGAHIAHDPERGPVLELVNEPVSYVRCGNDPAFDLTSGFTISVWIRPASFSGRFFPAIVTKGDRAWRLQGQGEGHSVSLHLQGACTSAAEFGDVTGTNPVDDERWHHVAGVFDGRSLRLYLDGRLEDQAVVIGGRLEATDDPVRIGNNFNASRARLRFFEGRIDDVRIFGAALGPEELARVRAGEELSLPAKPDWAN
ncbi:MAG: protein kinase [Verrucomicrobiales bacterium]|nr:protein kinase [Verrucomicrobiales bacterium]